MYGLFKQNDEADGMYFIEDGAVKITMIKEVCLIRDLLLLYAHYFHFYIDKCFLFCYFGIQTY